MTSPVNSYNLYEWFSKELITPFSLKVADRLANRLGLAFIPETENGNVCFVNNNQELRDEFKQSFSTQDLLDFIYAVIHSSLYQKKSGNVKAINYDSIPSPKDDATFWKVVKVGKSIRLLHQLKGITKEMLVTSFPVTSDNPICEPKYAEGKVYINEVQFFDNVPESVWGFISGNIQPARQWLIQKKGNILDQEEIEYYQKILAAIAETERIVSGIGEEGFE